jgi:hypothetical protein
MLGEKANPSPRPDYIASLPDRVDRWTEAAHWLSIQRNGLLCASKLLDRVGIVGVDRDRLEREQRITLLRTIWEIALQIT